jgi:hypothetical protein
LAATADKAEREMMKSGRALLAICLAFALVAYSQGNTFDRIRYTGGTIETKVKPKEWKNRLTVTSELIKLELKGGQTIEIDPTSVRSLSYGQEAHRRVGTMVALGVLLAPLALFGLFHKTRLHYVGVQYTDSEGNKQGLLLQAHKKNYRAVLLTLQGATGAPVSVAEEERKYLAVGTVVAEPELVEQVQATDSPREKGREAESSVGVILLSSNPESAEVWVDGSFVGNTPAKLSLAPGKHRIRVFLIGYEQWIKDINVTVNSEVNLKAVLKKSVSFH